MTDWIEDPNLSLADKLARFESLGPELTRGPRGRRKAAVDVVTMPCAVAMPSGLTFAGVSPDDRSAELHPVSSAAIGAALVTGIASGIRPAKK